MISIVCPVYNREKYLPATIESVLNQTYSDFELILVDDGSTDKSFSVMEKYAKKDERIKIFTKENAGASSAREYGYHKAEGEYFVLLDSDDLWKNRMLEKQMEFMQTGEYESVFVCLKTMNDSEIENTSLNFEDEYNIEYCSGLDIYKRNVNGDNIATSWAVLHKKDFFDREIQRFIDIKDKYPFGYFNDSLITAQITCSCKRAVIIHNVFVLVRTNDDSICRTIKVIPHNLEKMEHFKAKIEFIDEFEDKYPYYHEIVGYYMTMMGIWARIKCGNNQLYSAEEQRIWQNYDEYFNRLKKAKLELKYSIYRICIYAWKSCPKLSLFFIKKYVLKVK